MPFASEIWNLRGRLLAPYHVQLKLLRREAVPDTCAMAVTAEVVRVFRGAGCLRLGDKVTVSVPVARPDVPPPAGAGPMLSEFLFSSAKYLEAFLDGAPPAFDICRHQFSIIREPSDAPYMSPPTEADLDESSVFRNLGGENLDIT